MPSEYWRYHSPQVAVVPESIVGRQVMGVNCRRIWTGVRRNLYYYMLAVVAQLRNRRSVRLRLEDRSRTTNATNSQEKLVANEHRHLVIRKSRHIVSISGSGLFSFMCRYWHAVYFDYLFPCLFHNALTKELTPTLTDTISPLASLNVSLTVTIRVSSLPGGRLSASSLFVLTRRTLRPSVVCRSKIIQQLLERSPGIPCAARKASATCSGVASKNGDSKESYFQGVLEGILIGPPP